MLEIRDNPLPLTIYWEETIPTALQQSEVLRQSILKKAFEGRLVAQDPKEEPASKLLERMKEDKGKDMPKTPYAKRQSRRNDIIIEGILWQAHFHKFTFRLSSQ